MRVFSWFGSDGPDDGHKPGAPGFFFFFLLSHLFFSFYFNPIFFFFFLALFSPFIFTSCRFQWYNNSEDIFSENF